MMIFEKFIQVELEASKKATVERWPEHVKSNSMISCSKVWIDIR